MRKILIILAFFIFIIAGCGSSSVEKTATDFTQKLYESDTKKVVNMLYLGDEKPSKTDMDFIYGKIDTLLEENNKKAKEKGGFKKAEVIKKDIDKNEASVKIQTTFKDGTTQTHEIDLIKVKNEWKVRI